LRVKFSLLPALFCTGGPNGTDDVGRFLVPKELSIKTNCNVTTSFANHVTESYGRPWRCEWVYRKKREPKKEVELPPTPPNSCAIVDYLPCLMIKEIQPQAPSIKKTFKFICGSFGYFSLLGKSQTIHL